MDSAYLIFFLRYRSKYDYEISIEFKIEFPNIVSWKEWEREKSSFRWPNEVSTHHHWGEISTNVTEPESNFLIEAKISGNERGRNILYSFVEPINNFFLNKKEILLAQIEACRKLSVELSRPDKLIIVENEIRELEISIPRI